MKNVEISVTYDGKSKSAFQHSSDDDSSSDEDEPFKSMWVVIFFLSIDLWVWKEGFKLISKLPMTKI